MQKGKSNKGRPSGIGNRDEGIGPLETPVGSQEQNEEMTERYTEGADELPVNAQVKHPNRNVNKWRRDVDRRPAKQSYKSKNTSFEPNRKTNVMAAELPDVLTKELFSELANFTSDGCISVYLPTHPAGVQVNEQLDTIAFKNILQKLTADLKDRGFKESKIQEILKPGFELLRDQSFWHNQQNGLGVFMADGFFRFVKMTGSPEEEMLINNSFYLKPLVPVMTMKEYFYLLVLSKKKAKFYKADAFGIMPIRLGELPYGVDDVVHLEEKEDQYQMQHEQGVGEHFHGARGQSPDQKDFITLYLEEVDNTLWQEILNKENAPLLLAGVDYLLPIYKSKSRYNFIWEDTLTGNFEHEGLHQLFPKAKEKMKRYFEERTKKALENYANQSARPVTSFLPEDVIPAAYYGRVWHLFVRKHEHIWGSFDEKANALTVHDERQDGDDCLLDKAVIKTILNGGDVHFLSKEEMPKDAKVAALMRY